MELEHVMPLLSFQEDLQKQLEDWNLPRCLHLYSHEGGLGAMLSVSSPSIPLVEELNDTYRQGCLYTALTRFMQFIGKNAILGIMIPVDHDGYSAFEVLVLIGGSFICMRASYQSDPDGEDYWKLEERDSCPDLKRLLKAVLTEHPELDAQLVAQGRYGLLKFHHQ